MYSKYIFRKKARPRPPPGVSVAVVAFQQDRGSHKSPRSDYLMSSHCGSGAIWQALIPIRIYPSPDRAVSNPRLYNVGFSR